MTPKKILFILSLLGVLVLTFLSQTTIQIQTGTIKSIQSSNNKITIYLKNFESELILFNTPFINLKPGNQIKFQGKQDIYKGKKQIIADKVFLLHHNNS